MNKANTSYLSKLGLIALREYTYNFRRPMYLFTAFGLPIILAVVMYFVFTTINQQNNLSDYGQVGYIDLSEGQILSLADDPDERFVPFADIESARAALDKKEIEAYFVLPEDYLLTGNIELYSLKNPPWDLHEKIDNFAVAGLATLAPDNVPFERLKEPVSLERLHTLSDNQVVDDPDDLIARLFVPLAFAMFLFITLNTTSQFLMGGVVEEKENRIMEILVTSCTPGQLLWGKIIGLGAISLTQVLAWGAATIALSGMRSEVSDFLANANLKASDILFFALLFILSYFVNAALALGVGAIASAEQEARQFAGILGFINIVPVMFLAVFMSSANLLVIFLCLFPLTSPISLLLGRSFNTLPAWVIPSGLIILVISIFVIMALSIRIFRAGMLMYGQRLGFKEIWAAIRQGQQEALHHSPTE